MQNWPRPTSVNLWQQATQLPEKFQTLMPSIQKFFLSNLLGLTIRLSWTSFYMSLESLEPGSRTANSSRSTTTPNSATSVFRQLVGKATTRTQGLRGLVRRHRHRQAATSVSVEVEGEEWSPSWNAFYLGSYIVVSKILKISCFKVQETCKNQTIQRNISW